MCNTTLSNLAAWSPLFEGVVSASEDSSKGNAEERGCAELASTGSSSTQLSCSSSASLVLRARRAWPNRREQFWYQALSCTSVASCVGVPSRNRSEEGWAAATQLDKHSSDAAPHRADAARMQRRPPAAARPRQSYQTKRAGRDVDRGGGPSAAVVARHVDEEDGRFLTG